MKEKKIIDWEKIEGEYRSGQLSISQIALSHGCARETISRRISSEKWERDLTAAVQRETKNKLARITSQITRDDVSDQEIIEAAADKAKTVIVLHRADIAALREVESQLITELRDNPTRLYLAQYQGNIIEKVVGLTVAERAMAANNLANVQHKRIQLERQAFNIDEKAGDPNAPDSITLNFRREISD